MFPRIYDSVVFSSAISFLCKTHSLCSPEKLSGPACFSPLYFPKFDYAFGQSILRTLSIKIIKVGFVQMNTEMNISAPHTLNMLPSLCWLEKCGSSHTGAYCLDLQDLVRSTLSKVLKGGVFCECLGGQIIFCFALIFLLNLLFDFSWPLSISGNYNLITPTYISSPICISWYL